MEKEEEVRKRLEVMSRRELQELSKTHGINASRKTLVLVNDLVHLLSCRDEQHGRHSPAMEQATKAIEAISMDIDAKSTESAVKDTNMGSQDQKTSNADEENAKTGQMQQTTPLVETKTKTESYSSRSAKADATASFENTKQSISSLKLKSRSVPKSPRMKMHRKAIITTSTPTITSSRCKFDELHAKELEREPTIYEHEATKMAKAMALITYSTKKAKRNASKANGNEAITPVTSCAATSPNSTHKTAATARTPMNRTPGKECVKTPSANRKPWQMHYRSSPTNHSTLRLQTPLREQTSSATTARSTDQEMKPKRKYNYKPYTGPVPEFTGESLFSPKRQRVGYSMSQTIATTSAQQPTSAVKRNIAKKSNFNATDKGKENENPIQLSIPTKSSTSNAKGKQKKDVAQTSKTCASLKETKSNTPIKARAERRAKYLKDVKATKIATQQFARTEKRGEVLTKSSRNFI